MLAVERAEQPAAGPTKAACGVFLCALLGKEPLGKRWETRTQKTHFENRIDGHDMQDIGHLDSRFEGLIRISGTDRLKESVWTVDW